MGRKQTKQLSFFQVLLDDFTETLSIPHKFTKKHIPPSLGKCVLSGFSGKRSVELQRRKNGLFFNNHGWHCFVKDHLLQLGDFLVFRYDGKKKFKGKVYDRTCCEMDGEAIKKRKGLPIAPLSNEGYRFARVKEEIVDDQETESCSSENEDADNGRRNNYMTRNGKRLKIEAGKGTSARSVIFKSAYSCFKANITSNSARYRIVSTCLIINTIVEDNYDMRLMTNIPKAIVDTKGLRSKENIDIEDSTGRLWPVKLKNKISSQKNLYLGISTGWVECYKAINVAVGDVVVFEFVEESVMRLHVFRKGVKARGGDTRPLSVVLDAPNIKKKT